MVERQIELGLSGLRLMPVELLADAEALRLLGEAGLCLMAINLYENAEATRVALDWLER